MFQTNKQYMSVCLYLSIYLSNINSLYCWGLPLGDLFLWVGDLTPPFPLSLPLVLVHCCEPSPQSAVVSHCQLDACSAPECKQRVAR